MYDLIIVGSGPAGLSAALSAKRFGLDYLVLERGVIASTVYNYPIGRPLFSTSNEIELEPGALSPDAKPTREQVLAHYAALAASQRLNLRTGVEALKIARQVDGFVIMTHAGEDHARAVLLAIGGFGCQRELHVPGEEPSRVAYRFVEAHPYALQKVLVIGGGNSAAEAAFWLAEVGAKVTLSLRRAALEPAGPGDADLRSQVSDFRSATTPPPARIKPWVREPLERAAAQGKVRIVTSSQVVEILPDSALLRVDNGDSTEMMEVECDKIFALIGADPDTSLLRSAGAEIAPDGRPVYDPRTHETTIAGLYVAGHITRELHMRNATVIPPQVVAHIASQKVAGALGGSLVLEGELSPI